MGHRIATRTFRDKKQQQQIKADPFFQLNFNVYIIGVDNRERARARDKKQWRPEFCLKNNMKIL